MYFQSGNTQGMNRTIFVATSMSMIQLTPIPFLLLWLTKGHSANQNHGGVFTLSPPNAQLVMDGGLLEDSAFPPGFVSLVSSQFSYLLSLPGSPCTLSTAYGNRYDGGILCTVPLRSLKIYSLGLLSGSAPAMQVEIWYNRTKSGQADSSQAIRFHQIGGDSQTRKQGYSIPVIPGAEHSYQLSLLDANGDIPSDWVCIAIFLYKCIFITHMSLFPLTMTSFQQYRLWSLVML